MKKQRGSAAILALVFMLFLAVAGGAWVTMLAQENATAMNDEKEQQAWYAAEAGMKRAKAELVSKKNSKSDWQKWLTQNKDFPGKGMTIYVATGEENSDAEKAKYAVYIGYDDTTVYDSGMATGKTSYAITSVGYYMDATKIINDTITVGNSGGDGGDAVAAPGVANAGGNIIIADKGVGSITGDVYAKKVSYPTDWMKINGTVYDDTTGGNVMDLYTHVNSKWFIPESTISAQYEKLYGDGWLYNLTIPQDKVVYLDSTLSGNHSITAESGSRLYVYGSAFEKIANIIGPTGDAKPLIVVCEGGIDSGNLGITGNVIIISNQKVSIRKWGIYAGYVMIFSNEDIELINGLNVQQGFISSDKNITYVGGAFIGQMQAKGNITIGKGGTVVFSADVVNKFGMPEDIEKS